MNENQTNIDYKEMAQRALADFANYKRNAEEQLEQVKMAANKDAVVKFAGLYDTLKVAKFITPEAISPVFGEFMSIMRSLNVSFYGEVGDEYDSDVHDAVVIDEVYDYPSGYITKVIKSGVKINGKIVSFAKVAVSKYKQ